jgi:hypothetical protein
MAFIGIENAVKFARKADYILAARLFCDGSSQHSFLSAHDLRSVVVAAGASQHASQHQRFPKNTGGAICSIMPVHTFYCQ